MGHLSSDTKSRFDKTPREWLTPASQINEVVNGWAERSDIVTFVGEGAGHGAPACFVPAIAEMEVDVSVAFGEEVDPRYLGDLRKRDVQYDHPVACGAILHEAFHARHSTLELLQGINKSTKDRFTSKVAIWLEETRIEGKAVKAMPENRSFLRASALRLVIGDLKEDEDFTARGIQAFSQLVLLTLARVDAGVLESSDVSVIQDAFDKLFDEPTRETLRSVWLRGQKHINDRDGEGLVRLAEEWVKALEESGNDPKSEDELPDWLKELLEALMGEGAGEPGEGEPQDGEGSEGEDSEGKGSEGKSDEAKSSAEHDDGGDRGESEVHNKPGKNGLEDMADRTETKAIAEGNATQVQEVRDATAKAKAAAAAEAADHASEAGVVFGRGTGPGGGYTSSRLQEERPPKPAERVAAVALAKELERARYRDRVVVKRKSVVPPGRLGARQALAAAEQKSRGVEVTATPWTRKQRFHTEDPELKVGMLVDISGSMGGAMEPMASAAWVMSEAVRRIQGKVGIVYYGNSVFPVLKPGQHLNNVQVYSAPDGTEKFDQAFRALNGAMGLLDDSGARLLVVVSDLYYTGWEGSQTVYWMKRCREAGVAVIVIPFGYDDTAKATVKGIPGVEVVPSRLTGDIVGAAKVIGAAAVRQLEVVSG